MNGAFCIGAIGLDAQQRALDVVANNIANINTVGFKRATVRFSELLTSASGGTLGAAKPGEITALSGVAISATPKVWTTGDLNQTGAAMDIAIDGAGFLEILGPSGRVVLWRGGSLKVNADGYLAAADGSVLRGMISVPDNAARIAIDSGGKVSAVTESGDLKQIGQLDLVVVRDLDNLVELGEGRYEALDASETGVAQPGEDGAGRIVQGALEASNVRLSDEMMSLLLLQRAFAANAQVVQAGDQLMSIINTLRR